MVIISKVALFIGLLLAFIFGAGLAVLVIYNILTRIARNLNNVMTDEEKEVAMGIYLDHPEVFHVDKI